MNFLEAVGRRWQYPSFLATFFHAVTFYFAFEATDLFRQDGTALKGWKWDSDLDKFVRTEADTCRYIMHVGQGLWRHAVHSPCLCALFVAVEL